MEDDLCSLISSNQDANISENTANSGEDRNFKTFTIYSESESTSEEYGINKNLKEENISHEVKERHAATLSGNKYSDDRKINIKDIDKILKPYSQHKQFRHLHNELLIQIK